VTEEAVSFAFQPRSAYAGYRAFSGGDGSVLVDPEVARGLRQAAEAATQEQRDTGGLLYGGRWVDDEGVYLVVHFCVEAPAPVPVPAAAAGGGGDGGDRLLPGNAAGFALSAADLRLLREEAATRYPDGLELGWWRSRAELGEFSAGDFATQAELAGTYGVGLLVYGSGAHWGTAYLGPDGHAPEVAGTLVTAPGAVPEPPPDSGLVLDPEPAPPELPELVDIAAGESLVAEPLPPADAFSAPARGRGRPRGPSRVRVPPRVRSWAAVKARGEGPVPETPSEVQFVIWALAAAVVAVAVIIGILVHSLLVALIIAAAGLLGLFSFIRMSRR
jgi:hypothetical protein